MNHLHPTLHLASVADLTPQLLDEAIPNTAGVIFDLDKTLVGQHELEIPDPHFAALASLSEAGFVLGIISNAASQARTDRVRALADRTGGQLGREIAVVTSRMVGGKKKPLRPVFDEMVAVSGIGRDRLTYVGDQLLKDVLGANRAGYGGSVLVAPYGHGDDPRVRYLQRPLEVVIRPFIGVPLLAKNFGIE